MLSAFRALSRCEVAAWVDFRCNVEFQMTKNGAKTEKTSRESVSRILKHCFSETPFYCCFSFSVTKVTCSGIVS